MTPAVVGDTVYIGSCSGRFYAFDRRAGDVRWSYDTSQDGPPANFHGDALAAGELIVVGSDVPRPVDSASGQVYAFEQATGVVRWQFATGVASDILRAGDRIFGVTVAGELVCFDLATGELRWRVAARGQASRPALRASVLPVGERLVFSSPAGWIVAVDAGSGDTVWAQQVDDEVNTSLALLEGDLFAGTLGNMIHRLDADSGELVTSLATDGVPYGVPLAVDGSLLVLIGGRTLARVDAGLREVRWGADTLGEWSSFRPQLHDGRVLVGDDQKQLAFVDLGSGKIETTVRVAGTVRGFTLAGGLLHVGTLDGTLATYRP